MKQKIYIGAAAIVMAGIFLLAGGKPVVAKAEKIKKVKIASAEKTVLINKKEKIDLTDSEDTNNDYCCILYTSPSPRDRKKSRMPSSA